MKKIFLILYLLIFCLPVYSQTNNSVRIDTNSYRSSINENKLEPAWVYIGEAKRAFGENGSRKYFNLFDLWEEQNER